MQIRWSRFQNFAWELDFFWIQHTQSRLKSLVPNFYSKMLLTFTFPRNPTRLWIQDEGKSNEGRERGGGGGGGGGRKKRKWIKCPHYSIDMKSTLPTEVIRLSVDGGGDEFLCFCRYIWNFVRTNETTQGHHCIDKILVISNEILRRIVCFRRENTKLSARLARSHSFHFFRVSGSSVSSLGITKQINQHKDYCTDKICYFPTRYYWLIEKNHMFPTQKCQHFGSLAPLARNNFYGFFSSFWLSGRNKSSLKGPYHECYDIGAGNGGRGAAAPNPKSGRGAKRVLTPPPPPKKKRGRKKKMQYIS